MVDPAADQKRNDDPLADRFGRRTAFGKGPAFEPAAGVDEIRVSARRLNQQRISLTDVDRGDDEIV